MDARLVTSQQHTYVVPRVRELPEPAAATQPTADETHRARSQRDLVAASLIACPKRY